MSSNLLTNARYIIHDKYDGRGYTNEETINRALLTKPDKINPVLTWLQGQEGNEFPLTFLTEGQKGGVKPIELNNIEYEWDVIRRMKRSDAVMTTTYSGNDKAGFGNNDFYVIFETDWLKIQHTIVSKNGIQARIQGIEPYGVNFRYRLKLVRGNASSFCPLSELVAGTRWGMLGGASVSQSGSKGNASNVMTPGKMKNQINIIRKSIRWQGNIANKQVECQFTFANGTTTSKWMPFEMWIHQLELKRAVEETLWYSQYNRNADGSISLIDPDTGLPIPMGAGIYDQIPNNDTYGILTAKKIKSTVREVMYQTTDSPNSKMDIVLYTGIGGQEEFDNAMKEDLKGLGFGIINDKTFISGAGNNLSLGAYFTQYRHIDGHIITVKRHNMADFGAMAEVAPRHPKTGLPLTSYDLVFLDQSTYGGVKNIQMVTEKGRSMRTGLVKGMASIPMDFGGNSEIDMIADEVDEASLHYLCAKGVVINRNTNCFRLTCDLS